MVFDFIQFLFIAIIHAAAVGSERYMGVYYLSIMGEDVLHRLAQCCSKNRELFAPGEKIWRPRRLAIIVNQGQVYPKFWI